MPECPELHLASLFVNRTCEGVVFSGAVEKSDVSKCPEVPFCSKAYRIKAQSRGKEVRLTLTPIKSDNEKKSKNQQPQQPMDVVFRFGMSGFFRFTTLDELPKHAHLRFYTNESPPRALSFVDIRRFGGWQPNGTWQADRGPCVMFEYESFRANVLSNLSDKAFDRPICEALLNQKYFNGIGNYLRAEVLYRSQIPPFVKARTALEDLESKHESKKKAKPIIKTEDKTEMGMNSPDLLYLCHAVPLEVVKLGGKGYDPQTSDYSPLITWMKCYGVDGMKSLKDRNGRTIWFQGEPGPMAPKGQSKTRKREWGHTVSKKAKKKRTDDAKNETPVKKKEIKNTTRTDVGPKAQKTGTKVKTEATVENKRPSRRTHTIGPTGRATKYEVQSKAVTCEKRTTKAKPQRRSSRAGLKS